MRNSLFTSILALFTLTLIVFAFPVSAQLNQLQPDLNVGLIPENPGPNQKVTVTLTSYSTDLNRANITWRVNGKTEKTGKGEKTFSFTTGSMNTTTTLSISVYTTEGDTISKTFQIRPTEVDLFWQTESYTPPFYRGRALFSHQNKITFIATPHIMLSGTEISPKNLIYKWSKNGSVVESASGYGKNTYTFISPLLSRSLNITVEVSSSATASVGLGNITVTPTEPSLVFYRKNPLYGIQFQKALTGNVELTDSKEVIILGVPFYFGVRQSTDTDLTYKWAINNVAVNNDRSENTQIFRPKEGTSGVSNISLSIENQNKILQFVKNNFNLNFGNQITQ